MVGIAALVTLVLFFVYPDLGPLSIITTYALYQLRRRSAHVARARAKENERRAQELITAVKYFK